MSAEDVCLQSDVARVTICPREGGRVASFTSLLTGVEFLWQSPTPYRLQQPGPDARFVEGAAAGIEECLPTVAKCHIESATFPDHGDFWQHPWQVTRSEGNSISLQADGFSLPLRFAKRYSLHGSTLRVDADIMNIGDELTPLHYALHPLLAIESGDRIALPPECGHLLLYDSAMHRLGKMGDKVAWPHASVHGTGRSVDLSVIDVAGEKTAEMLYTPRLKNGVCGLYRKNSEQGITLRFSPEQLPWMGMWICCGGWPEDGAPRQYAFAPEPTTAPCGSLAQALEENTAKHLMPGEHLAFHYEFTLSAPGIAWKAFAAAICP